MIMSRKCGVIHYSDMGFAHLRPTFLLCLYVICGYSGFPSLLYRLILRFYFELHEAAKHRWVDVKYSPDFRESKKHTSIGIMKLNHEF